MSNVFFGSAEIRWFFHDDPSQSDQLLKWFTLDNQLPVKNEGSYDSKSVTDSFVKREAERVDEYLLFPDCDTVGVKQRQGKLEVKALVTLPRPFLLPDHDIVGRIDQWVKWSFKSAHGDELAVELNAAGPWRKVVKNRYLQKYSFDSGKMTTVPPDQWLDIGCNIELTWLTLDSNSTTWLTFAFEAFGPSSGHLLAVLNEAVECFFNTHGHVPVRLNGRDSLSYPSWLAYCLRG